MQQGFRCSTSDGTPSENIAELAVGTAVGALRTSTHLAYVNAPNARYGRSFIEAASSRRTGRVGALPRLAGEMRRGLLAWRWRARKPVVVCTIEQIAARGAVYGDARGARNRPGHPITGIHMINPTVASALKQGAVQAAADGCENPDIPPVAVEHIDRLCAMVAVLLEVPFVAVVWAAKGTRFQRCWVHGKADDPDQRAAIRRLCASSALGGAAVTVRDLHQLSPLHSLPVHGSPIRACAGVPLITPTAQLIGHLYAMDLVSRLWSERELRILTTLCSLVVLAIKLSEAASESDLRLQAITAEREKQDEMLADIAHDLRQPLAVISLTAELLSRDELRCRQRNVDMLRGAVQTMATLISDLLAGEARSTLDLCSVSPAALIRKAVANLTPLAAGRGLRLEGSMDQELPAVCCDPSKIQRVYSNLVGNAIQHAAPSSVVRLEGRRVVDGVQFSVINAGPGIAAGDAPHVFERGWRACHQGDGHGLGLAIVRKLVEAQGGSVAVRSVAGTTSFCFTLPLSPVPVPMNDTEPEAQSA